ncbi:MAG: nucleotidyltransferase family protein [Desulfomonilaceae bacterium]
MNKQQAVTILSKNRLRLSDYHVRALYLFRSVVEGQAGPDSDLDILDALETSHPYRNRLNGSSNQSGLNGAKIAIQNQKPKNPISGYPWHNGFIRHSRLRECWPQGPKGNIFKSNHICPDWDR